MNATDISGPLPPQPPSISGTAAKLGSCTCLGKWSLSHRRQLTQLLRALSPSEAASVLFGEPRVQVPLLLAPLADPGAVVDASEHLLHVNDSLGQGTHLHLHELCVQGARLALKLPLSDSQGP
eukprot:UN3137